MDVLQIYHVVGFCYLSGLEMSSAWALVLGLSCLLLGLVVGFVSRPHITSRVSVSCIGVIRLEILDCLFIIKL